jgi:Uma2 family endonuclease
MANLTTPKMTAEEFFDWANRPENEGKHYELVDGEVVEMPSPGEIHGLVCSWIVHLLWLYVTRRGDGRVLSNDTGLVVRRGPDTVRGPDIMLFLTARRLVDASPGHVTDVPELIVEVRSPTDRDNRILRRVEQYHRRGVPLVWVVDPEDRVVTAYRPNEFPKVLDEADDLTGNGVLPDFSSKVADLFALPDAPPAPPPGTSP